MKTNHKKKLARQLANINTRVNVYRKKPLELFQQTRRAAVTCCQSLETNSGRRDRLKKNRGDMKTQKFKICELYENN